MSLNLPSELDIDWIVQVKEGHMNDNIHFFFQSKGRFDDQVLQYSHFYLLWTLSTCLKDSVASVSRKYSFRQNEEDPEAIGCEFPLAITFFADNISNSYNSLIK